MFVELEAFCIYIDEVEFLLTCGLAYYSVCQVSNPIGNILLFGHQAQVLLA